MTDEQVVRRPRRTQAEVEQIVCAFEESGLNRSQFCQREGLKLMTLNRYLKRVRGEANRPVNRNLVPVELREAMLGTNGGGCGLVVVLAKGRRIEVGASFDEATLQRLVQVLEAM